jgi:hypothetical protein
LFRLPADYTYSQKMGARERRRGDICTLTF